MEFTRQEIERLTYRLSDQSLHFLPEFQTRVRVLRRLGYLRENDQLKLKGMIVEAEVQEGLMKSDAEFEQEFKFGAVDVVYKWAKGEQFSKIMECTDVDEGTIVSKWWVALFDPASPRPAFEQNKWCITRLDEVLRCIKDVSKIVGDVDFGEKMDRASKSIRRDIVFAASLYVQ
eukprot:sb/3472064/